MTYAETSDHAHYVTVTDAFAGSQARTALAAGPYATRAEAEAQVEAVRSVVRSMSFSDVYSSAFLAVGTSRVLMRPGRVKPVGKLNHLLHAA